MTSHFYRYFTLVFFYGCRLTRAGVIPDGYAIDRYSSLWMHSPFTIASVQQAVVTAGFANRLALVGFARIGSEDIVTLLDKESQQRIFLSSKTNDQDLKLVCVEQDADLLKISVTIQKGTETGKVKFDPSLLGASSPQNPAGNPPPQEIPLNAGQQNTQSVSSSPVSDVHRPPVIPLLLPSP